MSLLCSIVIITWLLLSVFQFHLLAFQRSGAILICITIYSVYLNHLFTKDQENLKWFLEETKEFKNKQVGLQLLNKDFTKEKRMQLIRVILNTREKASKNYYQYSILKTQTSTSELIYGILWTLILWFWDLLFI